MILEDIAKLIEDQEIATMGTTLFSGELPLDFPNSTAMIYSPSPEPDKSLEVYEMTIDFWNRNRNSENGFEILKSIMDFLHRKQNYETQNYHIYLSYALGMIEDLDRDSERRKLYKLSMRFIYRELQEEEMS